MKTQNPQFNSIEDLIKNDLIALKIISNDIINTYLITHLKNIGLESKTNDYLLNLYEIVFEMLGFKLQQQNEELKDWYFLKLENICNNLISLNKEFIQEVALDLLIELKNKK